MTDTQTSKKAEAARMSDDLRGAALARAIEQKTAESGMTQKEVARALDISEPYFNLLISGERWFGSVSKEKLSNIANFLDIPIASVYMLAEVLVNEDWITQDSIDYEIENVYKTMQRDKRYTVCMPTPRDWRNTPRGVKLTCVLLYQELSNKQLIEKFKLIDVRDPESDEQSSAQ